MPLQTEEAIRKLHTCDETRYAIHHALSILMSDGDTVAPRQSWRGRAVSAGYLGELSYRQARDPALKEAVDTVLQDSGAAPEDRRLAELFQEDMQDMLLFSEKEYVENQKLMTEASAAWHEAKEKSEYQLFAPFLEKIIAYNRTFAARKDSSRDPYDVLLDRYEKGICTKSLDGFFDLLRTELTPLIRRITEMPKPRTDFLFRSYPLHLQRAFSDRLMAMMGLTRDFCAIGETEHPFTSGPNKWDVRITTKYHEFDPADSMFSVLHEGGHALYEAGVDDSLQFTRLAGGSSMGIHESQSRFYENLIGRSLPFSRAILPVLKSYFPEQLSGVTAEEWYRAVNLSEPSFIRTEADELTYPIHVLIRYEIEKQMISGSAQVKDLPGIWNDLYETYLGIRPSCDREGILQDSHWSGAGIAYFPSYALGSAYGVQMLSNMEKDMDVWGPVEKGDMSHVTAWLREHIHRFGQTKTPGELLISAGVDPFDPHVYVDYLKNKYTGLYGLS